MSSTVGTGRAEVGDSTWSLQVGGGGTITGASTTAPRVCIRNTLEQTGADANPGTRVRDVGVLAAMPNNCPCTDFLITKPKFISEKLYQQPETLMVHG